MSRKRPTKGIDSQYPHSDRNAELQEYSLRAVANALPPEKFVFREERKIDAGVDGTIEIKILGDYTGMRAYVQVKSSEQDLRPKKDGSIAYPIKVSNLHYLLNHPCPLYLLYIVKKQDLRCVWAWEEVHRIERQQPGWASQQTVTLMFKNKLNSRTRHQIHERIRADATIHRSARTILSGAGAAERVKIEVDKAGGTVTDPTRIRDMLLNSGLSLVSSGAGPRVLELLTLLSPSDRQLPKMLLVSAYAELLRSRYLLASAHVAEASPRSDELSEDDRDVLNCLKNICDQQCGRITTQEYKRRQKEASEKQAGSFAACSRILYLRQEWLSTNNPERKQAIAQELAVAVEKVVSDPDCSDEFKLHARLVLLFVRGGDLFFVLAHALVITNMRLALGARSYAGDEPLAANAEFANWQAEANAAVESCSTLRNRRLCGEALYTRASVIFAIHSIGFAVATDEARREKSKFIVDSVIPSLENAVRLHELDDDIEGVLRSKVLIANFYDLLGEITRARELASAVRAKIEAFDFKDLSVQVNALLAGMPAHRQLAVQYRNRHCEDTDATYGFLSDEDVERYAKTYLQAMNLPIGRLPLMQKDVRSQRGIAIERNLWCRHIDLVQDLTHLQSKQTAYAVPTDYWCVCHKHRYKSVIGDPDWSAIIHGFKSARCAGCPDRDPNLSGPCSTTR